MSIFRFVSQEAAPKNAEVLKDPQEYKDMYEKCYQLRRSELHFIIARLPKWVLSQGIFLGGTSEGAMTVTRFDDQRYGDLIIGRFINSFSILELMILFMVFDVVFSLGPSQKQPHQSWLLMVCNDFDVSQKARLQSTPRKKQGNTIIYYGKALFGGNCSSMFLYVLLVFLDQADHKAWSIATSHRSRKLDCWVGGWTSPPWTSLAPRRAGENFARFSMNLEGSGG